MSKRKKRNRSAGGGILRSRIPEILLTAVFAGLVSYGLLIPLSQVDLAEEKIQNGNVKDALDLLAEYPVFNRDHTAQIVSYYTEQARRETLDQDYESAAKYYQSAAEYGADVGEQLEASYSKWLLNTIEEGSYSSAERILTQAGETYGFDLTDESNRLYYAWGKELMSTMDYTGAKEKLLNCRDYPAADELFASMGTSAEKIIQDAADFEKMVRTSSTQELVEFLSSGTISRAVALCLGDGDRTKARQILSQYRDWLSVNGNHLIVRNRDGSVQVMGADADQYDTAGWKDVAGVYCSADTMYAWTMDDRILVSGANENISFGQMQGISQIMAGGRFVYVLLDSGEVIYWFDGKRMTLDSRNIIRMALSKSGTAAFLGSDGTVSFLSDNGERSFMEKPQTALSAAEHLTAPVQETVETEPEVIDLLAEFGIGRVVASEDDSASGTASGAGVTRATTGTDSSASGAGQRTDSSVSGTASGAGQRTDSSASGTDGPEKTPVADEAEKEPETDQAAKETEADQAVNESETDLGEKESGTVPGETESDADEAEKESESESETDKAEEETESESGTDKGETETDAGRIVDIAWNRDDLILLREDGKEAEDGGSLFTRKDVLMLYQTAEGVGFVDTDVHGTCNFMDALGNTGYDITTDEPVLSMGCGQYWEDGKDWNCIFTLTESGTLTISYYYNHLMEDVKKTEVIGSI